MSLPPDAFTAAAGGRFSLAVLNDGTCRAWGDNFYGQLGDGSYEDRHAPVAVHGLSLGQKAAAGILHAHFLLGATHDLQQDTDGDGLTDGEELAAGTNPYSEYDVLSSEIVAVTGGVVTISWEGRRENPTPFFEVLICRRGTLPLQAAVPVSRVSRPPSRTDS